MRTWLECGCIVSHQPERDGWLAGWNEKITMTVCLRHILSSECTHSCFTSICYCCAYLSHPHYSQVSCLIAATGRIWSGSMLNCAGSPPRIGRQRASDMATIACVLCCDVVNMRTHVAAEGNPTSQSRDKYLVVPDPRHIRIRQVL